MNIFQPTSTLHPLRFLALACLITLSETLLAAETDSIRKHIENLSDPNVLARTNACHSLGQASEKDQAIALDALLDAMRDPSGTVRGAAVQAIGNMGPGAARAIPRLIDIYRDGSISKTAIINALVRIGPDSPAVIDLLMEVVRGGRSGSVRPMSNSQYPLQLRHEAIHAVERIGPKANKAVPVLLDLLAMTAADIEHQWFTFGETVEALSIVGVGDKRVFTAIKRLQQGKGLPAKSKNTQSYDNAILAADSALKRLQKFEKNNNSPIEKEKP